MTVSTITPHNRTDKNEDYTQRSNLYRKFLAERDKILKYKWIDSEKQDQDIGFERALLDWIRKHRSAWRADRNKLHDNAT